MRLTRGLWIAALAFTASMVVPSSALATGDPATRTEVTTTPFELQGVILSPCTGDLLYLSGSVTERVQYFENTNGAHLSFSSPIVRATGYGIDEQGQVTRYVLAQSYHSADNYWLGTVTTITSVSQIRLVSAGPAGDYVGTYRVHVTYTGFDEDPVVFVEDGTEKYR